MRVRKSEIFIITNDKEYIFNELFKNLLVKVYHKNHNEISFLLNEYRVKIVSNMNESARGHRPEIVYIFNDVDVKLEVLQEVITPMCHMSTRINPVRIINSISDIDILEMLYDNYAENKCDKYRLNRFNELICK